MGKNNKARRAAKARSKAKSRPAGHHEFGSPTGAGSGSGGSDWRPFADDEPMFSQAELARNVLLMTAQPPRGGERFATEGVPKLCSMPASVVNAQAESLLLQQVSALWANGWQPAELHRQGRRGCSSAAGVRLVVLAIATDHANRRAATLDGRWIAQIDELALPSIDGRPGWVGRWARDEGLDRSDAVTNMVDALANVYGLPRLDAILPPPGAAAAHGDTWASVPSGHDTDPMLKRVRALLAKAESTTFEAEATALTAKAQELMTRHAIDAAMLHNHAGPSDARPVAVRIPIDAPYTDAKSLLLQTVGEAGRCRSIFHERLALSTLVGFADDLAATELLFTSLLVQAQTALSDAAKHAPAGTRMRSQSYRSAFLLAYAERIGDRLQEINEAVFAAVEAEQGSAFLPVLRSQSAAVDDFVDEHFGRLVQSTVRGGYDAAGWAGGRRAADNAQLNFGDLTEKASA